MRQASRKLQTNGFWTHVYYDRFADFGQHYALFEFDTNFYEHVQNIQNRIHAMTFNR